MQECPAAELRKLVKIVRQYEVIYGGGISSSDAALREECEGLVGILESELGIKRGSSGSSSRTMKSLPSLVEAKKAPRRGPEPKPSPSRASEIARLGQPSGKGKAGAAKEAAAAKPTPAKAAPAKAAKGAAAKSAAARGAAVKSGAAEASPTKAGAAKSGPVKGGPAGGGAKAAGKAGAAAARPAADDSLVDLRSRHVSAARAGRERDDRIADAAGDSGEAETKRRFAAIHLFDAFKHGKLPKYGGYIVTIRFDQETGYAVVEIIGYENLQDIYPEGETLVFKSVGCKLYAIVEPTNYYLKSVEPVNRPNEQMIPYRFSELLRITTKRFQTILVGRKPVFMPTSFSVFKPAGEDLAVLFYDIADVYANIQDFIIMILRDRLGIPVPDSRKAGEIVARGIREFKLWMDEA